MCAFHESGPTCAFLRLCKGFLICIYILLAAMQFLSILLAHFLELPIIGKNSYYTFAISFLISGCYMNISNYVHGISVGHVPNGHV